MDISQQTHKILSLYEQAMALESLASGQGFDAIGRAFCDFLIQPRKTADSLKILESACNKYPNFITDFQRISHESEHLHEKFHADKLLNGTYQKLDELKDAYGYSWIGGKARAELALIPDIPYAKVDYYCGAMVPFSVMALRDLRPDMDITLVDNDRERLIYSRRVLDSDEAYRGIKTRYIDLDNPEITYADMSFLIGARFQSSVIFDLLHKARVESVALNGCEGLCVLMYPALIDVNRVIGYAFDKGFTPLHKRDDLRKGFTHSKDLSYLSLAAFHRAK